MARGMADHTMENGPHVESRRDSGAESRNRTGTPSLARDFESRASTCSAISATRQLLSLIYVAGATSKSGHFLVATNRISMTAWDQL